MAKVYLDVSDDADGTTAYHIKVTDPASNNVVQDFWLASATTAGDPNLGAVKEAVSSFLSQSYPATAISTVTSQRTITAT